MKKRECRERCSRQSLNILLALLSGLLVQTAQAGLCAQASSGETLTTFAVVDAPEGYANLRDHNKEIVRRLPNQTVVYLFDSLGQGWCTVDLPNNGLLHESGVVPLDAFPAVPRRRIEPGAAEFADDRISVQIRSVPFNPRAHRLTYDKENPDLLKQIDGADYYGNDGGMPTEKFQSITIRIGEHRLTLPPQALKQVYDPYPETADVRYDRRHGTLYLSMLNGDAAGSYHVLWVVRGGRYQGRHIALPF